MTDSVPSRRQALRSTFAAGLGIATFGATQTRAADAPTFLPKGAKTLEGLHHALEKTPCRRDFKAVPMILEHKDQWDNEALDLLRHNAGGPRQVWNNTNLEGPWLNLMRNAMNAQIWSFGHPDFFAVSATHGSAHLALFDEAIWDKFKFAALTQGKAKSNTWMDIPAAASADAKDIEDPKGVYSPGDNSIPVLQRRGAVLMACHNAIWEISGKLIAKGVNPDKLSHEAMAAELTNHLVPGVVLPPASSPSCLNCRTSATATPAERGARAANHPRGGPASRFPSCVRARPSRAFLRVRRGHSENRQFFTD